MKKIKWIKTIGVVSTIGITSVVLSASLASCSETQPNLIVNSWEEFNQYFETHHDEYKTPDTPLNLNSATSDEIIDYFFSHKRISGQNLLYSIFLELGTTYYDNYDTPLKLKISTTDNSVSAKFASDFEFDFGLSPLGSSKQQIKRGIDMILKDSYIKIQVSQSEICVEASVTQRVWLDNSNQDYAQRKLNEKFKYNFNNSSFDVYGNQETDSHDEPLFYLSFSDRGESRSTSLHLKSAWYPDVNFADITANKN